MTIHTKIDAAWKIFITDKPNELTSPRNPSMPLLVLLASAAVLLFFFLFYNFFLPQAPSRMIRPSVALIPEVPLWSLVTAQPPGFMQNPNTVALLLLSTIPAAFLSYAASIYIALKYQLQPQHRQLVTSAAILFSLLGVFALPNINSDIFYYVMQGRIATVYQQNPYYVSALEFPADPIFPFVSEPYRDLINVYPPVWTLISMLCTSIAGSDPVANLIVLRLMLWLFSIANMMLIAAILGRINPQLQVAAIVFYGWNPIVALLGTGKPDTVMAFFLLGTCFLLVTNRRLMALIALMLSALVKLITLPLIAVFMVWYLARGDWRRLLVSALTAGLVLLVFYLPFLQEPGLFLQSLRESGRVSPVFPDEIRFMLMAALVLVVLVVGFVTAKTVQRQLWGLSIVMLYFALFLTAPVNSWYLITFIAIVCVTLELKIGWLAVAISAFSFFLNTWELISSSMFPLSMGGISRGNIYLLLLAAIMGILAVGAARRLRPTRVRAQAQRMQT